MTDLLLATGAEPSVYTERLYNRLPDFYRTDDTRNGMALLAFIASIGDEAGDVEVLFDRLNFSPWGGNQPFATLWPPFTFESWPVFDLLDWDHFAGPGVPACQLTDPDTCDPSWLPWIAQFLGLTVDPAAPIATQRLSLGAGRPIPSTVPAIIAAAQAYLTGTKVCRVTQYTPDQWTYTVTIHAWQVQGDTYDELEAMYPTIDAFETAFPHYTDIPSALPELTAALQAQVPAGMTMILVALPRPSYDEIEAAYPSIPAFEAAFATYADVKAWRPA